MFKKLRIDLFLSTCKYYNKNKNKNKNKIKLVLILIKKYFMFFLLMINA